MDLPLSEQEVRESLKLAASERAPHAHETARRKVEHLTSTGMTAAAVQSAQRLHAAATRASSARQRVMWLQRFVSAAIEPVQAVSACKAGCAHCCHVAVLITDLEAALLAQASGRRATAPAAGQTWRVADLVAMAQDRLEAAQQHVAEHNARSRRIAGDPCPFLDRTVGRCTVYETRPTACRTHLNLDDDALLCRLDAGSDVMVPLFDGRQLKAIVLSAQPGAILADIRAFFPAVAA